VMLTIALTATTIAHGASTMPSGVVIAGSEKG
jgi:hypothetical protein